MENGNGVEMSGEIFQLITSFLPLNLIKAKKGIGSFLTFDLNKSLNSHIHAWVYLCDWVIRHDHKEILSSSDSITESDLAIFEKGKLLGIEFDEKIYQIKLIFSDNIDLQIRPNFEEYFPEDDLIIIYLPDGMVAACSPYRGFYLE